MIYTTLDGDEALLINEAPSFKRPYSIEFSTVLGSSESLSNREGRRAYSSTLRAVVNFSVVLRGASLRVARGAVRALKAQPVLMPFWPAVAFFSDFGSMPVTGGLMVAFKQDWSDWSVFAFASPPSLGAGYLVAPLMVGFFPALPKFDELNTDQAVMTAEFAEVSKNAYALTFDGVSLVDGPQPDGYSSPLKILPFAPVHKRAKEEIQVVIKREQLGFSRTQLTEFYQHDPFVRQVAAYIVKTGAELPTWLSWFQDHAGAGEAFWAISLFASTYISVDSLAGDTTLNVTDSADIATGDYLCITDANGSPTYALVTGIGVSTIDIDSAFGVALSAGAMLRRLFVAKCGDESLKLSFQSAAIASTNVTMQELGPEFLVPGDETIGTTIGKLSREAFLYDFSWTLGGTTYHERLTGFEKDLTDGSDAYASKDIGHGDIVKTILLDDDQVDFKVSLSASGIVKKMAQLTAEAPVYLQIKSCGVSGSTATDSIVIAFGEVLASSVQGFMATPKLVPGGTKFDRRVPRPNVQRDCNNIVFDTACTLDKADWTYAAKIDDPGTEGYPFTFALDTFGSSPSGPASPGADFFAGGWIVLGAGQNRQIRSILTNTALIAGGMTVTLDRDPNPFPAAGDDVSLTPGCDGLYSTCIAKFDNNLNFLGFPLLPLANPSLVKQQKAAGGGKK